MNGDNKLECLTLAILRGLRLCNTLAYWTRSYVTKKIKFCDYSSSCRIHNTLFSSEVTNGTNKLEYYNSQFTRLHGLARNNTLVYCAHS